MEDKGKGGKSPLVPLFQRGKLKSPSVPLYERGKGRWMKRGRQDKMKGGGNRKFLF